MESRRSQLVHHLQDEMLTAVRDFEVHLAATFNVLSLEQSLHARDHDVLQEQYGLLEHAATGMLQNYRAHLNTLVPINRLPIETLQLIFQYCQCDSNEAAPTWNTTVQPVISLSRVCRRWRFAALGDPKLWTTISATDFKELEVLADLLPRSKALPVDLSVEWRMYSSDALRASVFGALQSHLHHLRTLRLNIRGEHTLSWLRDLTSTAPLLESFDLVRNLRSPETVGDGVAIAHTLFGGHAPRLRHVSIENVPLDVLDAAVFRAVTNLSLTQPFISPQDVRAVLASCPLVEDLTLAATQRSLFWPHPPQARRGGKWPCPALVRVSLTDVERSVVNMIIPHLPLDQLELLDIVETNLSPGDMGLLLPDTVAALIDNGQQGEDVSPKSIALRGTPPDAAAYPPQAPVLDFIVTTARGATRAFPVPRLGDHPLLLNACQRTPSLSVSSHAWPMLANLASGATFLAQKLTIVLEDASAPAAVCAAPRPLLLPKLKRLVLSAPSIPSGLTTDVCRIANRAVMLSLLRGSVLRKLVLKNVRHDGRLDEMRTVAERYEIIRIDT